MIRYIQDRLECAADNEVEAVYWIVAMELTD